MSLGLDFLISMTTGGTALGMSLYNFWKSRLGARLELGELVEIGTMLAFSPMTRQEHLLIYLPIQFYNEGGKTAMISDLTMTAEGPEGQVPMFLMKRVQGRKSEEIESFLPIFPLFVKSGEAVEATFEFMDGADIALKLDKDYEITLTAHYNNKQSVSSSYSLHLEREKVLKFPKLTWLHLLRQEEKAPPAIIFGKDM